MEFTTDRERDEWVVAVANEYPTIKVGRLDVCEIVTFLGLTGSDAGAFGLDDQGVPIMAAIVTEKRGESGIVESVDLFTDRRLGSVKYRDVYAGHRFCCDLYDSKAA